MALNAKKEHCSSCPTEIQTSKPPASLAKSQNPILNTCQTVNAIPLRTLAGSCFTGCVRVETALPNRRGSGGIGRRASLRSMSSKGGGGSSPLCRTISSERISGHAAVAELVDALASGASSRKGVEVQVLSAAPPESRGDKAFSKGSALSVCWWAAAMYIPCTQILASWTPKGYFESQCGEYWSALQLSGVSCSTGAAFGLFSGPFALLNGWFSDFGRSQAMVFRRSWKMRGFIL